MKWFYAILTGLLLMSVTAESARDIYNSLDGREMMAMASNGQILPVIGKVYKHTYGGMKVLQTVDGYSIVEALSDNKVAVLAALTYADGSFLRSGYYRYKGTRQFSGVLGSVHTFHLFEELPATIQDEVRRIAKANQALDEANAEQARLSKEVQVEKKKLAEEIATEKVRLENARQKLENEREISRMKVEQKKILEELAEKNRQEQAELKPKLQKEREAYAKSLIGAIDFNIKHHYVVQRSVKKMLKDVRVIDPIWDKLIELQTKGDWLGMLGVMDDDELDDFPKESEIDTVVKSFLQKEFDVSFKWQSPNADSAVGYCVRRIQRVESDQSMRWEDKVQIGKDEYRAKTQLLQGKLYFYEYKPGGTDARFIMFLQRKNINWTFDRNITPEVIVGYEEWLKEN